MRYGMVTEEKSKMTFEDFDKLRCRKCKSEYLTLSDMEYNGELSDGRIAPQIWQWECLDCNTITCTVEYRDL